ncbi:hypothetical protein WR25_10446 [Diploscapter pachys]|uniref:Amino acid permease/ SLC12A domain-containing protein n=1 Tax=Diploscapter pachys TaxID=2018661 RepID=A0A2A2M202_9BILA|nr:hypothetical protein WR25_10446 [Diploscapter pachys]
MADEGINGGTTAATNSHKMGLFEATGYVVGNIIGSGIFITPGSILGYTKSIGLSLIVWIGCGILSLLGAICYIELATAIPEPGADFAYSVFVGWEALAFCFMWSGVFISFPASAAVQAQTFGKYITAGIDPVWTIHEPWRVITEQSLGFVLIILLSILNLYAIDKYAGRFQVIVTISKMLSLAVIIFTGFYLLIFKGWTQNLVNPMEGSVWNPGSLVLAFYGGLWSYAGIFIVTSTYVAVNISYFVVLTPGQIVNSSAVAAEFAQEALGNFSYAIPFMVALLLLGTLNSNIFVGSRFTYAAAREKHLPSFLSCVNEASGSPRAAVLWQMICTIIVSFVDIDTLINYVTFVMWGQRVVTILALLWIRYRKIPVADGAIRVPIIFSILFLISSITLVIVPFIESPLITTIGAAIVFSGMIFFYLLVKPVNLPRFLRNFNDGMARVTCKLLVSEVDIKRRPSQSAGSPSRRDSQHRDELQSLEDPTQRPSSPIEEEFSRM